MEEITVRTGGEPKMQKRSQRLEDETAHGHQNQRVQGSDRGSKKSKDEAKKSRRGMKTPSQEAACGVALP